MTPERMKKMILDFIDTQGLDAPLLSCACCGFRNLDITSPKHTRSYSEVDLANEKMQSMLMLRDEDDAEDRVDVEDDPTIQLGSLHTLQCHRQAMERAPLCIPCNDDGDTKEVEAWKLNSVWPAKKPEELVEDRDNLPDYMFDEESGEPLYYHLHPEFVQEKVPGDPIQGYTATICSECEKVIESGGSPELPYPRRSIAAGVDFGDANRIGLEPLTERERQIISKIRHYLLFIKIESNTADGRVIERGQSKVKGCGIYFDDDSTQVVSDLLSQEGLNGNVSLQFVGPDGEYDALAAKVLGNPNVEGRAWVIYQWLKVLKEVNLHYEHDDELPNFDEVKAKVQAANEALIEDAECVDDEGIIKETEIAKDDVRRVRTNGSRVNTKSKDGGDIPFKCSILTSSVKKDKGTDIDSEYLDSAAKALGTDEKQLYAAAMSRRERDPLNDYEKGDETIAKAAPDVFMFGTAYGNKGPNLNQYEMEHLIMQYTARTGSNRPLLFQLFESDRRQSVIRGMHAKVCSNQKEFEQFANEFNSDEFQAKLRDAVKNPKGRAAKYVMNKLVPVLTFAGKKSHFGALERNESAGQILALGRHFGCAPAFLTFGIDDVNHPNAIRFALHSTNNQDFPAVVSNASQVEMKGGMRLKDGEGSIQIPYHFTERLKLMVNNPVGAAIAYKQVVHDVMTILFGIKPSNHSGHNSRTTKTGFKSADEIGMVGSPWAFFGKTETTGSGSLHFHVVGWAGISPELLESVADVPELCKKVASVLDSQYNASLDRRVHVEDLVRKNIGTVKGLKKTCAPAKVKSRTDTSVSDVDMEEVHIVSQDTSDLDNRNASQDTLTEIDVCAASSKVDMSIPGGFALKKCRADESCNDRSKPPTQDSTLKDTLSDEEDIPDSSSVQDTSNGSLDGCATESTTKRKSSLKRSKPMSFVPKSSKANETAGSSVNKESWTPMVMHRPPDPVQESDKFKNHVVMTICRCGIHEHTFTCHKPKNGWHGCRLCYTKALSNGTQPIELIIVNQPDGTFEYYIHDSLEKSGQQFIRPYDPEEYSTKANEYPLRSDCSRTIVWELDRPELEALDDLDDDMTKEQIISKLYNAMLPSTSADKESQFKEGSEQVSLDQVDIHQFCEQDENNLFYNLLLGLIESPRLKPGSKSVEGIRRELMQGLIKMSLDCKLGDKTVEEHIKARMDSRAQGGDTALDFKSPRLQEAQSKREEPIDDTSIKEKVELYSQLMLNVTGDDCFGGGALEVYLFARLMDVNVAVYAKEGNSLTRVDYIAANGDTRSTIHLLRTPGESCANRSEPVINPPEYKYKLFTPKLKDLTEKLQAFDVDDLKRLYNMVSKALPKRNEWVVDFNPLLTSLLGCNSNLLHLGSTEQSKAALFYIGPYINKDGVKITDALPLLSKAHEHALNYPSVADDTGTAKRYAQHALQRALNKMNNLIEVTDTQAAASLLGMGASLCSESFATCDIKAFIKYVNAELQRIRGSSLQNDDSDSDDDAEKEYYDEMDILVEDDEEESIDDVDDESDINSVPDDRSLDPMECEDTLPLDDNDANCEEGDDFKFINASCGSARLYTMNDGTKQPVSYAALYRYRGEGLKHLNRYEYTTCVHVIEKKADNEDTRDISDGGRKKNKAFSFGTGLNIEKNYHQVLRSKQCIPKFTKSPPALPTDKSRMDENELIIWRRKADRFAHFYLTLFRPEDTLYDDGQTCDYEYNYDAFVKFYDQLRYGRRSSLDLYRLSQIDRVMYSWRVDRGRREMLAKFRGRNRTLWSDTEKEAAKSHYGKFGGSVEYTDDGMDYVPSDLAELTTPQQNTSQKIVGHGRELLDTLKAIARQPDESCVKSADTRTENTTKSQPMSVSSAVTLPFNNKLDQDKRNEFVTLNDTTEDKIQKPNKFPRHLDLDKKVDEYIDTQKLSDDKTIAIKLVREHFDAILSGRAESKSYQAPNLLICGKPGNGKSKLVEALDGIAEIMKVGSQMKCAYMGSAAVNIAGTTLLKSWNIPVFNKGEKKVFSRWNDNKLNALKKRFGHDFRNISAVVIDEVSTIQPYMLAYLNDRMQEIFQVFDKPFGGRMVILLGDFQQKPPTSGISLPQSVMEYVKKGESPTFADVKNKKQVLGPTKIGGYLFSKFRYIKLTSQHRSEDPTHMEVLNKMSETGVITVNDLKTYDKLSSKDLDSDDFRFATIIVTGNNERREINAWQAKRWAEYYGRKVIRWTRKRRENTWKGKPTSMDGVARLMENACFWELFIPGAKGYLNTYNINGDLGLANGTEIKYHSLSFKDRKEERRFEELCAQAKPGDVIRIDSPPAAINVELFADFPEDTADTKAKKVAARKEWLDNGKPSSTEDGRVVIHISQQDGSQIKYTPPTHVPGFTSSETRTVYPNSQIEMKDHFPIEPAFSITVDKAQVSCQLHDLIDLIFVLITLEFLSTTGKDYT